MDTEAGSNKPKQDMQSLRPPIILFAVGPEEKIPDKQEE